MRESGDRRREGEIAECEAQTRRAKPTARGGRLTLVGGIEMRTLKIPRRSLRGRWMVNMDAALIDRRRYRRMFRRMLERLPRVPPSDECFTYVEPRALRKWRLRRSIPHETKAAPPLAALPVSQGTRRIAQSPIARELATGAAAEIASEMVVTHPERDWADIIDYALHAPRVTYRRHGFHGELERPMFHRFPVKGGIPIADAMAREVTQFNALFHAIVRRGNSAP